MNEWVDQWVPAPGDIARLVYSNGTFEGRVIAPGYEGHWVIKWEDTTTTEVPRTSMKQVVNSTTTMKRVKKIDDEKSDKDTVGYVDEVEIIKTEIKREQIESSRKNNEAKGNVKAKAKGKTKFKVKVKVEATDDDDVSSVNAQRFGPLTPGTNKKFNIFYYYLHTRHARSRLAIRNNHKILRH